MNDLTLYTYFAYYTTGVVFHLVVITSLIWLIWTDTRK